MIDLLTVGEVWGKCGGSVGWGYWMCVTFILKMVIFIFRDGEFESKFVCVCVCVCTEVTFFWIA